MRHLTPMPTLRIRVFAFLREWGTPIAELAIRLAAILLAAHLLLTTPIPLEGTSLNLVQALIVLAAVVLVGISMYETLFHNPRYRP